MRWDAEKRRMEAEEVNVDGRSLTKELSLTIGSVVPGKSVLLYGSTLVYYTALVVMKEILRRVPRVAVIDGANRFDAYGLARMAQIDGMNPVDFLNRIFISRIFTAFQMDGVITRGLGPFLKESKAKVVIVLGLLHTFYDDQISVRESEKSLARIGEKFGEIKESGVSLLLASENMIPEKKQKQLFHMRLRSMADDVYEANPDSVRDFVMKRQNRMPMQTRFFPGNPPGEYHV